MQRIIDNEDLCSGCHACFSVCPIGCIQMELDKEGFLYPVINQELCIHCGLCQRACNIVNEKRDKEIIPTAYAIMSNNEEERINSSSGGVFALLCRNVIADNGIIFAVEFNAKEKRIQHVGVESYEDIYKLQGAKYAQSAVGKVFHQVKENLEKDRLVLFVGTPCQIAGLDAFLGKRYNKLILVDFICHGVPSQKLMLKYLNQFIKEDFAGVRINFRDKKFGWQYYSFLIEKDDKTIYRKIFKEDGYLCAFIKNKTLRKSCYKCSHKTLDRKSDITLGDFWGVTSIIPDMNDGKGTSLVLVHTEKGQKLIREIEPSAKVRKVDAQIAIKHNPSAVKSVAMPKIRETIYDEIDKNSIKHVLREKISFIEKMKIRLKILLRKR